MELPIKVQGVMYSRNNEKNIIHKYKKGGKI